MTVGGGGMFYEVFGLVFESSPQTQRTVVVGKRLGLVGGEFPGNVTFPGFALFCYPDFFVVDFD